jgi:hypothetical protein
VAVIYDLRIAIEKKIKEKGVDEAKYRGLVGLKAGRLLSLISANTPDDPAAIAKLRNAAREVLGVSL